MRLINSLRVLKITRVLDYKKMNLK